MRVLAWTEFYWPSVGGGELFTKNLLRGLRERGIEVAVVSGRLGDVLPEVDAVDGIAVHRFPFRAALERRDHGLLTRIRADLLALLGSFQPHLLHMTWMGPCGLVYRQLHAAHPVPTLITLGQHLYGDVSADSLRGRMLRDADWVAACANWMRQSLLERVPELAERSSVVYHAVPPAPAAGVPLARPPQLLCLGRLVPSKGFDVAVRALVTIARRHPGARLLVAGDGPERGALAELVGALDLGGRVELLGRVHPDDTAALIAASALVLMPSHEETFGLVALETAQQGRPIVASGVEGLTEVVADGETGLLVPPGDAAALADAACALLDDPGRCAEMGRRARHRVGDLFAWERHLDAYEALYRRLGRRESR